MHETLRRNIILYVSTPCYMCNVGSNCVTVHGLQFVSRFRGDLKGDLEGDLKGGGLCSTVGHRYAFQLGR